MKLAGTSVAGSLALLALACGGDIESIGQERLSHRVELVEETTESFANAMLDLSDAVRRGDMDSVRGHLGETVQGSAFPAVRGPLSEIRPWILGCDWLLEETPSEHRGDEWAAALERFRACFSAVEDVRFKVKSSRVVDGGVRLDGRLAFWLVGRDHEGRREWARGRAHVQARRLQATWQIASFELERVESLVASEEFLTEVAEPAGLWRTESPHGAGPAPPFAAHGAAVADVDLDGLLDLFVCSAEGNSLYRNRGDGTFEDVAEEALVSHLPSPPSAPLFFDHDGDGDQDLFVSTLGQQVLFENRLVPEGQLAFLDVSDGAGVARWAVGFSAVSGDVDGNGHPDIYVTSYNRYGEVLPDRWDGASNGTPNLLFLNRGDGTFEEAAAGWGAASRRWSYAAAFADVDSDGDLDLYVANDFGGPNELLVNQGGRFSDRAVELGVADGGYGMGADFGDHDNDGDLDLHVTRMSSTAGARILSRLGASELPSRDRLRIMAAGNALYENLGGGSFRDTSAEAGPFPGGWAWGGGFVDLDNDGWQDLHTPNGFISGPSLKDT